MVRAVSSQVFVGREEPLSELADALRAVVAGAPRLVLVAGEAGVGKTRLLDEFLCRRDPVGFQVLLGCCVDLGDRGPPFAAFGQALRPVIGELPSETRDDLLGTGERRRGQLYESVLQLLGRLTEQGPVVLAVEDVHWADRSTRDLLSFLLRNFDHQPVLLLLTYRIDWLPVGHPVTAWVIELERNREVKRLDLPRFTEDEVIEQVTGILGAAPDPGLVRSLLTRAEGNAFYTEELIAAAGGEVGADLPPTLREILLARIHGLPPPAKRMLRLISAGGRPVPAGLVALLAGLPDDERTATLRQVIDAQLLEVRPRDRYAFRHELLREAVYANLLPTERLALHHAFAAALDQNPALAGTEDATAAERAHHWLAAGVPEPALRAAVQAGEAAWRRQGYAEALAHWQQALRLWKDVPDAPALADADLATLARRTAEAANLAGEHSLAAHHARAALAALDEHAALEDAALLYERLGRYLWAAGDSQSATAAYDRALDLASTCSGSPVRARVLAARGQALMLRSRYGQSRVLCEEAIELSLAAGVRAVEGHASNTLGFDLACLGAVDEGVAYLRKALAIAVEVGDLDDLLRGYVNLSEALVHAANRFGEAAEVALAGAAEASRRGLGADYGVTLRAQRRRRIARVRRLAAGAGPARRGGPVGPDRGLGDRPAPGDGAGAGRPRRVRGRPGEHRCGAGADVGHGGPPVRRPALRPGGRTGQLAGAAGGRPPRRRRGARRPRRHRRRGDDRAAALARRAGGGGPGRRRSRALQRGGDGPPACARSPSRASAETLGDSRPLPPLTAGHITLCRAEVSRLAPENQAGPWEAAAAVLDGAGNPYLRSYAEWREAEALLVPRRAQTAGTVLHRAHDTARGLGARPLLAEIEALARRGRIDPTAPPSRSETAEPSPPRGGWG